MQQLRRYVVLYAAALLSLGSVVFPQRELGAQQVTLVQRAPLPASFTDAEFWAMMSGLSEPGGYFQSDNFTSNETNYPAIAAALRTEGHTGGAYLGVGPEQNFQYIAAIRPKIVFQFDIRRQAILQHLMYKAIFELSADRAGFVSLLFTKPRPAGLDTASTISQIWDAYWFVPTDTTSYASNLTKIWDHLTKTRGLALNAEDRASLAYVYEAFYRLGPVISYNGYGSGALVGGVNFATLTNAQDAAGMSRSFLATEEAFRFIREMHRKNLIIPVVADFAGPKGIKAVGEYLAAHDTKVTAFYVSNVEDYLFRNGVWQQFYANVATLPLDSGSVFIRPTGAARAYTLPMTVTTTSSSTTTTGTIAGLTVYFTNAGALAGPPFGAGPGSTPIKADGGTGSSLCPIQAFLRVQAEGRIKTSQDAVACFR